MLGLRIGLAVEIQEDDLLLKAPQQVVAAPAIQLVQALTTDQRVTSTLAPEQVVTEIAQQRVAAGPSQNGVISGGGTATGIVTIKEVVAPVTVDPVRSAVAKNRIVVPVTVDRVVPGATFHLVATRTAVHHVGPVASGNRIVTTLAVDPVVAVAPHQGVVTVTTDDRVTGTGRLVSAVDQVVSVTGVNRIGTGQPIDLVVAVTTGQHVGPDTTSQRVIAVTTVGRHASGPHSDDVIAVAGINHVREVDRPGDRVIAVATLDRHPDQARPYRGVDSSQALPVTEIDDVGPITASDQDRLDHIRIQDADACVGRVSERSPDGGADQDLDTTDLQRILADHDGVIGIRKDGQVPVEEQRGDREQGPVLEHFSGSRSMCCTAGLSQSGGPAETPRPLPTICQAVDPRCDAHGSHSQGPGKWATKPGLGGPGKD